MTVVLSIVGWFAISAICAPVIGRFLFAMHTSQLTAYTGPAQLTPVTVHRRSTQRRRALHVWPHRTLRQSKAG